MEIKCPEQGATLLRGVFQQPVKQAIQTAKMKGATMLITVSPVGMERLLRLHNFKFHRAGTPSENKGKSIVGLAIWLSDRER